MKKTTDEENAKKKIAESSVEYVIQHDKHIDSPAQATGPEERLVSALRKAGLLVEREYVRDMTPPMTEKREEELAQRLGREPSKTTCWEISTASI